MNKILFLFTALTLIASCKTKTESNHSNEVENKEETKTELLNAYICTELHTDSVDYEYQYIKGVPKFVGFKASFWPHFENRELVITVAFEDGNSWQKKQVVDALPIWENTSSKKKIRFVIVNDPEFGEGTTNWPDIRIKFNTNRNSSYIGRYSKDITNSGAASMFLGDVRQIFPIKVVRGIILHEFGHALGLIHEHQHPSTQIPWDEDAVYKYYSQPPNNWSIPQTYNNIFRRYNAASLNYSQYDPQSIMHYSVPNHLTIGDFEIAANYNLSRLDSLYINRTYPGTPRQIFPEDYCYDRSGRRIPCP